MSIQPELLDETLKIIRQHYGQDAVRKGSEQPEIARIELESPSLTRITGGGIPLGRISRLWGGPSSAKTHIGWEIVRAAQKMKLHCAYWNIEKQYDEIHCREHLGINTKKLHVFDVTTIEDLAEQMEVALQSIAVHVVDSCSFAVSRDELASGAGDWHRGLDARVWKKAIRRINDRMDKDGHAIILIDHAAHDMATKSEYAKGGAALEYASSMSLHTKKGQWLFYHPDGHLEKNEKIKGETGVSFTGMKEADGFEISVRVNKSRVCRPLRAAKMRLDLNSFRFDSTFELLDAATFFDSEGRPAHRSGEFPIVRPKGSWFELPSGEKLQGELKVRQRIEDDAELAAAIRRAMIQGY